MFLVEVISISFVLRKLKILVLFVRIIEAIYIYREDFDFMILSSVT